MKPRRAHSETRSSIRSRRRRVAGWWLDMAPRTQEAGAHYTGLRRALPTAPPSRASPLSHHAIEEPLAAQLDSDVEALEAADHRARLLDRARGQDQAIESAHVELERAIEGAQRSHMNREHPTAARGARAAYRSAVGDVEPHRLLAGELAAAAD